MRSFLAIPLPETLRAELAEAGRNIPGLRAQKPETIHLTIRFLGEVTDPRAVVEAVSPVAAAHAPFEFELAGIGAFPKRGKARVAWVGLARGDLEAGALAKGVETALLPLGFRREDRPYHAHVTLGRFRKPRHLDGGIVDLDRRFGTARADRLVLYSSTLRPEGALHEVVAELSLKAGM